MNGSTALGEALKELRSAAGAALAALFAVVGLTSAVVRETFLEASVDQYLAVGGDPTRLPVDPAAVEELPLSLGLSYGPSLALFALVALVSEYATIVTLRVVTGASFGTAVRRRMGRAVVVGFLVGVVVRTLFVAGLFALLLPGVFVAVSLLFAHAAVAIDDDGFGRAFRRAWTLAAGRRLAVLRVVALLAVVYLTPLLVGSVVSGTAGHLLVGVGRGLGNLLSAGIVGRAYLAAKHDRDEAVEQAEEDSDPYDAPLGPDDLPEPE